MILLEKMMSQDDNGITPLMIACKNDDSFYYKVEKHFFKEYNQNLIQIHDKCYNTIINYWIMFNKEKSIKKLE